MMTRDDREIAMFNAVLSAKSMRPEEVIQALLSDLIRREKAIISHIERGDASDRTIAFMKRRLIAIEKDITELWPRYRALIGNSKRRGEA